MKERHKIFILLGLALASRLIAFPFSQSIEADSTSRMLIAEHFRHYASMGTGFQWPSLHLYFLAAAQWISGDRVSGPVMLSLLLGTFSFVPFYRFTANIFNREGAFYSGLLFSFSPLIFRNSFTALAEIYHIFFCVTALWAISEGIKKESKKWTWGIIAGISATIASGGRFEAWILIGLLGLFLLLLREWKMLIGFSFFAALFPVYWLVYCFQQTGHALISLQMVQHQNFDIGKINDNVSEMDWMRRWLFFPLSWAAAVTPVAAFLSLFAFIRSAVKKKTGFVQYYFAALLLFFMIFFIYESLGGSLANQHR